MLLMFDMTDWCGRFPAVLVARATDPARWALARGSGRARHASPAFAVAILLAVAAGIAHSAPPMCADVQRSIEKRLADAGVRHPPLKIVPKNLATGYRVVGTCENGTQRIVYDVVPASSPASKTASKPRSASGKP